MLGVQPSNIMHAPCCVWGHISTITLEGIQETAYPTILTKMYFYECLFWYGSRSGVTRCTHFVALYLCIMCQSWLHSVLWSHISIPMRLPAAEPRSAPGLLFPSQYLSGTIWLTPYSMVCDWRVSRAGPIAFCWPSCSLLFCLQLFSLSLLFLYRLVVWGWGLRIDIVSISLYRPCIANLFK